MEILREQFLWFLKNYHLQFHHIFLLFLHKHPFDFSDMLHEIIAYLCPNMINFDVVDFSERRSEEVVSFFWCSVYHSCDS